GTPVYVQLTFWGALSLLYPRLSLGIPFGPSFASIETVTVVTAFWAALFGLAFNEAAYLAEIIRAGLRSVDPGQEEAAVALGMRPGLLLRRVVLPQAMRVIVPPLGNETISMLKTTSLVIAVPFTLDLFYATSALGNRLYRPIPMLVIASIWYLLITSALMLGQSYLERYFGKGFGAGQTRRRLAAGGWARRGRRLFRQRAIQAAGTTDDDEFLEVTP
ncbi:MAG: amino acid ABC transporter permease, partial [Promicromonosporaceae bacterium]|nr:amino acid ABC transporter permease [Promicromonosporaceae bacterium]